MNNIKTLREEYFRYLDNLKNICEKFDISPPSYSDDGEGVLSKGLKVRHSETGLLYTVLDFDDVSVSLEVQTSDGIDVFEVSIDDFRKNYEVD